MIQQAIDVKLAPGLLSALRGPKLWADLQAPTLISFNDDITLLPLFYGAAVDDQGTPDAWLINSKDMETVTDLDTVYDTSTGKFIFPLVCPNTHLTNGTFAQIVLNDWWTTNFPSAVSADLLTATFTLIVKNGTEQAWASLTVHRLPTTVLVDTVTERD